MVYGCKMGKLLGPEQSQSEFIQTLLSAQLLSQNKNMTQPFSLKCSKNYTVLSCCSMTK